VTIRSFAPGALASNRASDMFVSMRRELDAMQRQLATGKKADSFAGLGFERRSSLDARGKMAMLQGYQTTIAGGTLRLKVMAQVAERLDGMARETRSDLLGSGFDIGGDGRGTAQNLAEQRLREALDHLNKDVNGRHLFAGRSVEAAPVESYDRVMNGDPVAGRAGLSAVIAERAAAEVGVDGLGRLSTAVQPLSPTSGYTEFVFSPVTLDDPGDSIAFSITLDGNTPVAVTIDKARADAASVGNDGVLDTIGEYQAALQASLTAAGVAGVSVSNDGTNIRITRSATTGATSSVAIDAPIVTDGGGLDTLATSGGLDADTPTPGVNPTLQLTGNGAGFPFGFEIVSASSASSARIAGSGTAGGSPETVTLTVNGVPANNDTVSVVLRDKDGATHTIQLTARTVVNPGDRNVFQIGADQATTMNGANGLRAALETAIRDKATAVLKPRAAVLAAQEFFDGSLSNAPDRVAFAPPRLTVTNPAANTAQLTGDLSALGFEILNTTSDTGVDITTTFTAAAAGPPATPENVAFQLANPPADGDQLVLRLKDRTGASHTVTLTARTTPTGPNDFQIGTVAATVSGPNGIMAALTRTLATKAAEVLSVGEATAMDTSGTRPTLIWYKGDDATTPSARDTAPLRIDTSQVVGTGARANEPAIRTFLAQLGVLSDARFTNTPVERERYENLTGRLRDNLSPPYGEPRLEEIATDFGSAMATLDAAKDRHRTAANLLQDTLDTVEQASTEETAAAMLNLQTRLQASYQTTSMLSRLSLVNFL
jgi:hypothetical protein